MPSLIADNIFENLIQELPVEIDQLAREFGAFRRERAIRSPEELFRAVMLYCGLDYSLREVAANFTQAGRRLSDEAVRWRLSACEEWLTAVLQRVLPKPEAEVGGKERRLILVDGTTVQTRGATTTDYRIHLAWDWREQRVASMKVTDKSTGENLKLYEWHPGDVVLGDAGYARAPQLKSVREKGAEFIVRCPSRTVRMLLETGEKLNIAAELKKHDGKSQMTFPVMIDSKDVSLPAWLHAYRLPASVADEARRKMRKEASKRCRPMPKADALYLAGWTIILTSLDPAEVPADTIGKVYRGRWQIEMVIKRLKSILNIDGLRASRGSRLAQVYLLGKSLYALMIERRSLRLTRSREVDWRVWKIVADQIRICVTLSEILVNDLNPNVMKVLKERKRSRQSLRTRINGAVRKLGLTPCIINPLSP